MQRPVAYWLQPLAALLVRRDPQRIRIGATFKQLLHKYRPIPLDRQVQGRLPLFIPRINIHALPLVP